MFFSAIPTFGPSRNTCEANSGPGWLRCSPKTGAAAEGVFFNYYVFEQKGSAQYLIVQAPVPARQS